MSNADSESGRAALEREWDAVPDDPDPEEHLGYESMEVDTVTAEQYGQLLVLPSDESMLMEDAFIVTGEDEVADLGDWQ